MGLLTGWFSKSAEPAIEAKYTDIRTSKDLADHMVGEADSLDTIYTYAKARQVYEHNPIGFRCVNLIANNAAMVDLIVQQGDNEVTDLNNPLVRLLQRPNKRMGGARFVQEIVSSLKLAGNAYIALPQIATDVSGRVRSGIFARGNGELEVLNPAEVQVVTSGGRFPSRYLYTPGQGGASRTFAVDQITGACDLLHLRTYNPTDRYLGLPDAASSWLSVLNHNAAQRWNLSQLDNGAVPNALLSVDTDVDLTQEAQDDIERRWSRKFQGARKAGKLSIVQGAELKILGLDPKNMQYIEGMEHAARQIALAYGVPPQMLGIPGDSTYSNMEQAVLGLYQQQIFPLLDFVLDELTNWLQPIFPGYTVTFDEDSVPAVVASRRDKYDAVADITFLTINEKRDMFGFAPIRGGDDLAALTVAPTTAPNADPSKGSQDPMGGTTPPPAAADATS